MKKVNFAQAKLKVKRLGLSTILLFINKIGKEKNNYLQIKTLFVPFDWIEIIAEVDLMNTTCYKRVS